MFLRAFETGPFPSSHKLMEVRYFKGPRADTCIDEGSSHHATPTSDWHHWPEDIVNRTRSHRDMRPTLIMTWAMAMQMSRNDRTSVKGIGVTNYRVYLQNIRCTTTVVDSSVRTTDVRDACISFPRPKIKNIAVRYSQRRITRATTKSHRSRHLLPTASDYDKLTCLWWVPLIWARQKNRSRSVRR